MMKKLGIFGGTFNPIHAGHVKAALGFLEAAGLDELLVIPAGIPPHKMIAGEDDPALRLLLTRLAFEEADPQGRIAVSDMELVRTGKSYSFDTVSALYKTGDASLYLYCGTDMLLSFDRWYRYRDILSMVTLAYAGREVQSKALQKEVDEKIEMLRKAYGAKIIRIPLVPIEISSSEIREKLAAGEDAEDLLPPAVYRYIKEKGLYRT